MSRCLPERGSGHPRAFGWGRHRGICPHPAGAPDRPSPVARLPGIDRRPLHSLPRRRRPHRAQRAYHPPAGVGQVDGIIHPKVDTFSAFRAHRRPPPVRRRRVHTFHLPFSISGPALVTSPACCHVPPPLILSRMTVPAGARRVYRRPYPAVAPYPAARPAWCGAASACADNHPFNQSARPPAGSVLAPAPLGANLRID